MKFVDRRDDGGMPDWMRDSGVRGSLSKVVDSLAAGYPFSIVHLLEFENRRRILFK
jgi:hypothetical protein